MVQICSTCLKHETQKSQNTVPLKKVQCFSLNKAHQHSTGPLYRTEPVLVRGERVGFPPPSPPPAARGWETLTLGTRNLRAERRRSCGEGSACHTVARSRQKNIGRWGMLDRNSCPPKINFLLEKNLLADLNKTILY